MRYKIMRYNMRRGVGLLVILLVVMLLLVDGINSADRKELEEYRVNALIDNFDKAGSWEVKFSKSRRTNWKGDLKAAYEESSTWLKWLDVSKYKKEDILPPELNRRTLIGDEDKAILALKANFLVSGYNWITLEPAETRRSEENLSERLLEVGGEDEVYLDEKHVVGSNAKFIWLPGKVDAAYVYVWSNNYDYNLEAHFKDTRGRLLKVPVSNLKYKGWRNLKVVVPKTLSEYPLKFVRFKIMANPNIWPEAIYLYFDYFHAIVKAGTEDYPGLDLKNVYKYWGK